MPGLAFHRKAHIWLVLLCSVCSGSTVNFTDCLERVKVCATASQNCTLDNMSLEGARSILLSSKGFPVNSSDSNFLDTAAALPYHECTSLCKPGQEPFDWDVFSQEFAAWLLPYLALVSQLPFGGHRRTENLMSALLTLGSPTLAGYSLYVSLLNSRWLSDQLFAGIDYPNTDVRQSVVESLNGLQHVPLRVHPGGSGRFEALVVQPANDQWWSALSSKLDYSHTWSIASATSIAWVVVAYLITVADSLSNVEDNINASGQGTGSMWLWLLPIVVGWMVLSPRCDYDRVHEAYDKANQQVFVPDHHDPTEKVRVTSDFGLTIDPIPDWKISNKNITSPDESRIPPVFYYARVLSWSRTVYVISLYYRAAWRKWNRQEGFDHARITITGCDDAHQTCRLGSRDQLARYCQPSDRDYTGASILWPPGVLFNMLVASLMSLQLQWATTSAAILVVWFTPTTGLGCRSLAYLIYGAISTMVWMILVLSNALGYYAHHLMHDFPTPDLESSRCSTPSPGSRVPISTRETSSDTSGVAIPMQELRGPIDGMEEVAIPDTDRAAGARYAPIMISRAADWLRWIGKSLAIANAIGIIAISVFQYAHVYDTCYCNASVIGWGASRAFFVINPSLDDITQISHIWMAAVALALISCGFFLGSIYILRDSLPS